MHTHLRLLLDLDGKNLAVLRLNFSLDVLREILVPITFSLPVEQILGLNWLVHGLNALLWVEHVLEEDGSGLHRLRNIGSRPGRRREGSNLHVTARVVNAYTGSSLTGTGSILASFCISA